MIRISMRACLLAVAVSGLCAYADPMLTLIPGSGLVGALPGETTGWGFTIANDTPYYLLFDSSNFCEPGGDPQYTDCSNGGLFGPANNGIYTDFIATNVTLISPFDTVTQNFNLALQHGVGSYAIDSNTPMYTQDPGMIFVSFMEFDGNPFDTDNPPNQISGDIELSASAIAEAVPEPATWALTLSALLLALVYLHRKRARI